MITIKDNKFNFRDIEYTLEGTDEIDDFYIHLITNKGTLCFEKTKIVYCQGDEPKEIVL